MTQSAKPVLFVSYSHRDADYVSPARSHLQMVAEAFGFRLFFDRTELKSGDELTATIDEELHRARAAVVFLSNSYLNDEGYAYRQELQAILKGVLSEQLTLFVVPVEPVDSFLPPTLGPLSDRLWVLPRDRPLRSFPPEERSTAYLAIHDAIGKRLDRDRDRTASEPRTREEFAQSQLARILDRKYTILRTLGAGASAVVLAARDEQLGREVAVKVLLSAPFESDLAAQFSERSRVAATLQHPHIVRIESSEFRLLPHYIVMELVNGQTLSAMLKQQGRLAVGEALEYFHQIADALRYAHEREFVHGAIRPSNVQVDRTNRPGRAVISVHRLGRTTDRARWSLEDLTYLSPEEYRGEPVAKHTDQYLLGQLFYELIAGQPPAAVKVLADVREKERSFTDLPELALSGLSPGRSTAVLACLTRMLDADPSRRWPTMEDAGQAMRDAVNASDADLALARASFGRCVQAPEFFALIYQNLFALRPELKVFFDATDYPRQHRRLRQAMVTLFAFREGDAVAQQNIEDLARQHAEMGVRPEYYGAFQEAIMRAARAADGAHWTEKLDAAWSGSLGPGISHMERHAAAL